MATPSPAQPSPEPPRPEPPDAAAPGGHVRTRIKHVPPTLAVIVALGLYLLLPHQLAIGPRWLIPILEASLLVLLNLVRAYRRGFEERDVRFLAIGVAAVLNVVNMVSVGLLVEDLLYGGLAKGRPLLYGAVSVWLTNVIVYSLWFWQLDRGGPVARARGTERRPDFQFPQMVGGPTAAAGWKPGYVDYLYVSLTNAAAFSPTDTMPLTQAAKALMGVESLVSIVTVGIVLGRAVNIL